MINDILKIAIQKKGRLNQPSLKYLEKLKIKFPPSNNRLAVKSDTGKASLVLMRDNDIPKYVSKNIVNFGIVGLDVVMESQQRVVVKKKLGFCKCRLVIAVPKNSNIKKVNGLQGKRIATSYPTILKNYLKQNKINARIIYVEGSVEVAPYLKAADAVCDITQTGRTLREFNLKPIKTILKSQAVLIKSLKKIDRPLSFKFKLSSNI